MSLARSVAAFVVSILISQIVAFRTRPSKRSVHAANRTGLGKVDYLWTFGAPGSASPGFWNHHNSGGCFPGLRAWTGKRFLVVGKSSDAVPQITDFLGYKHAMMDSAEFDVTKLSNPGVYTMPCSAKAALAPQFRVIDIVLHLRTPYVKAAHTISPWMGNVTDFANMGSYFKDEKYVTARAKAMGWRLVNTATAAPGPGLSGGPQVAHLLQRPENLECLLTFQGTNSLEDWVSNFAIGKSHYCGLVDVDEQCGGAGVCKTRNKGSFTHLGFRDHLRRMIRSNDFQTKIRPYLGGCAKLHVGGHSLGGAMSELFSACVSKAPRKGQYGYEEDFKFMTWNKETPYRLPWL